MLRRVTSGRERAFAIAALAAWVVAAALQIAFAHPLKHDEAAYVLGARRWLDGGPPIWLYRSIGAEVLAAPGVALGSLPAVRIAFALASTLVPIGTYALARAAFPERAVATIAIVAIAGAHPMVLQSAAILTDLPSAGMLLCAFAVALHELGRDGGPRYRLVAVAPLCAAGFYLRYGSAPAIAAIGLALVTTHARALIRRPGPVIATLAVAVALAAPHVVFARAQTGSALGVLVESAHATRLDYAGQGLATYLTIDPFTYYGVVITPLLAIGVVAGLRIRTRAARALLVAALATFVALGVWSHAQPRYAFEFVALLAVLGAAGGLALVRRIASRPAALAGACALACAPLGCLVYLAVVAPGRVDDRAQIGRLADTIRRDAAGRACIVVAVRTPQLAYYSGCDGDGWPPTRETPACRPTYVVSLPRHPADPVAGAIPIDPDIVRVDCHAP